MKKVGCVIALGLGLYLLSVLSSKNNTEDVIDESPLHRDIRARLTTLGYSRIDFGDIVPSTDGSTILSFEAIGPDKDKVDKVAILTKEKDYFGTMPR